MEEASDVEDKQFSDNETASLLPEEKKKRNIRLLSLKESALVLLGVDVGTGILTMPFVIRQLEMTGWLVSLVLILSITCITTIALSKSTAKVLDKCEDGCLTRDPYHLVAEKSCGAKLRLVLVALLYVGLLAASISLLLICASNLSNLVPIPVIGQNNSIRVWSAVLVAVLTPITYLGTYSELRLPAFIAVATSLLSTCLIIVNCLLYEFVLKKPEAFSEVDVRNADQIFLIPLGTILFSTTGASSIAPNIAAVAQSPEQLHKSFLAAFICVFVVYGFAGIIPYQVFDEIVLPSTVSTFYRVINDPNYQEDIALFYVLTIVINALMLIHFCMAIVLSMNPLFLHMEELVKISTEFSWKRVCVRTIFMLFCLGLCLLVPHFEQVLSLTGGVPTICLGIIIPLLIYVKLFSFEVYQRILVYIFLLVVIALAVGNFLVSLQQIIFDA